MKKIWIITALLLNCSNALFAQSSIPYGTSLDSVEIYDGYYHAGPKFQTFFCYKPSTYDSSISPVLFAMHGSGGNGTSAIGSLDSIAERRKALIIAPNFSFSGFNTVIREQGADFVLVDLVTGCIVIRPATIVLNTIYKHVLVRENRLTVPVYMIGFSAGGQFVTRYMLWRQVYPDSIPIKMAVSSNAYYYTFPTDTFLGIAMPWLCGFIPPAIPIPPYCINSANLYTFCNEHAIQYYNENYGVLIGTGDTQLMNDAPCAMAQGNNRYERALNFYNFADSNAVNRGTILQWPYVEIPGVGHDQYAMYNNKINLTDTSTIAETLLFDTPYHTVPFSAPLASFYTDTTRIYVNGTINFFNTSINATSYLWDFGDGTTSNQISPSHTYTVVDTFTVQLTAYNGSSCSNWIEKRNYIKVIVPVGIDLYEEDLQIKIYPNPFHDKIKINHTSLNGHLIIRNLVGEIVFEKEFSSFKNEEEWNLSFLGQGIYFLYVKADGIGYAKKIVKM